MNRTRAVRSIEDYANESVKLPTENIRWKVSNLNIVTAIDENRDTPSIPRVNSFEEACSAVDEDADAREVKHDRVLHVVVFSNEVNSYRAQLPSARITHLF